jgi:phosphoheptose isomerase
VFELSVAIAEAYKRGNKVLICGNGGLAAESEHFQAELMGKYGQDIFIPCISLTGPSSLITALANDIGFDYVFAHQVQTLGQIGDLLIGMTTSASKNILNAIFIAKTVGIDTFLIDRKKIEGDTVGEVQNNIIKFLHQVALEAKELCVEDTVH